MATKLSVADQKSNKRSKSSIADDEDSDDDDDDDKGDAYAMLVQADIKDEESVPLCFDNFGDNFTIGVTKLAPVQEKKGNAATSGDGVNWAVSEEKTQQLFSKKVSMCMCVCVCVCVYVYVYM